MATASLTWGQFKFYAGGWSGWQNLGSQSATTSGNLAYTWLGRISTSAFDGDPQSLSIKVPFIRTGGQNTYGKISLYLYTSDPTNSITSGTPTPSGYISSGSANWNFNDQNYHTVTVNMSNATSIQPNKTYYILIRNTRDGASSNVIIASNQTGTTYWSSTLTYETGGKIWVKPGTSWKEGNAWVRISSGWKKSKAVWVNVNGTWRKSS